MLADIIVVNKMDAILHVRFFNNTRKPAGLALPYLMNDGIPAGNHFRFTSDRVTYLGSEIKRKPFLEEEIRVLEPGEIIYNEEPINLKRYYKIPKDLHDLEVSYHASHPIDGEGKSPTLLTSSRVNVGKTSEFLLW